MKKSTRPLLLAVGAVALTISGAGAAATGNLMAPPPRDPEPVPAKVDAGSADAGTLTPVIKKDGGKKGAK